MNELIKVMEQGSGQPGEQTAPASELVAARAANNAITPVEPSVAACPPGSPSPVAMLDQMVTAERLRALLWQPGCQPSLQWIRSETKRRMLPHIRRGRLIFYRPSSVLAWFAQKESRPASMKN